MMLKDRFSLLNYPEGYVEKRKLKEWYHSNTPEGKSYEIVLPKMPKRKMSMKSSELRTLTLGMPKNDEEEEFGKTAT